MFGLNGLRRCSIALLAAFSAGAIAYGQSVPLTRTSQEQLSVSEVFSSACGGRDLELGQLEQRLRAGGWLPVEKSEIDAYLWGVVPHDRVGFRDRPQSPYFVVLSTQGKTTREQTEAFRLGQQVSSDPVVPDRALPDPINLFDRPSLGMKRCGVYGQAADPQAVSLDLRDVDIGGERLGKPTYTHARIGKSYRAGLVFTTVYWGGAEIGHVNFSRDTEPGPDGLYQFTVERSLGIALGDPVETYLMAEALGDHTADRSTRLRPDPKPD